VGTYHVVTNHVETFNELVRNLDYPMFIVTAGDGDERDGALIGFATQASIHPPRFLVLLSDKNRTTRIALRVEHLGVHFLPADRDDLAELFGGVTADEEPGKLDRVAWHDGPHGVPLIDDCPNRFVARVEARLDCGDHIAHLLAPVVAEKSADYDEFTFHRAKRIEPGHEA
jgi:flavin reductase (DIM6/NTAB) family NADH-FMN oxidoreductase RutF